MSDSLESTWKDPYEGEHPRSLYTYVRGLTPTGVGLDTFYGGTSDWERYYRPALDERNIGSVIRDEEVIELGCG